MKALKIILLILFAIVALIVMAVVAFGIYRTIHSQHSSAQAEFTSGSVPNPPPDGLYNGQVSGIKTTWRGKQFDASTNTGINLFGDSQRYPFKTYVGQGATDLKIKTLKIDYNVSGNPLWLRPVLDEVVQTGDGQYLGKLQVRLIPRAPFTLGYFRLTKAE